MSNKIALHIHTLQCFELQVLKLYWIYDEMYVYDFLKEEKKTLFNDVQIS